MITQSIYLADHLLLIRSQTIAQETRKYKETPITVSVLLGVYLSGLFKSCLGSANGFFVGGIPFFAKALWIKAKVRITTVCKDPNDDGSCEDRDEGAMRNGKEA
jgi:hypothetical protein